MMTKFNRVQSVFLVTALISTVLLTLPMQAAIKQPQQLLTTHGTLALSWGDIWNKLRRRKVSGGGRGPICVIAPGELDDPVLMKKGIQEI